MQFWPSDWTTNWAQGANHLLLFATAIIHHWLDFLKGSAVLVVWGLVEKFILKREFKLKTYTLFLVALVAFSCYQAWLDQYTSANGHLVQNSNLEGQIKAKDAELEQWKTKAADWEAKAGRAQASRSSTEARRQRAAIQDKLSEFVKEGITLRGVWTQRLGQPEQVQRISATEIQAWHSRVEAYVESIPGGKVYALRFQIPPQTNGTVPVGIQLNLSGFWTLLASDLMRLNELIGDQNLGKL